MQDHVPSVSDIRAADQIVFGCLERWFDPVGWQSFLLAESCGLLGLTVGVHIELDRFGPDSDSRVLSAVEWGWQNPEQRAAFFGSHRHERPSPFQSSIYQELRHRFTSMTSLVETRRGLMADADWSASDHYRTYWQPAGLCNAVISLHRYADRDSVSLLLLAGPAESQVGSREAALLAQIHHGVAIAHCDRLATWSHVSPLGLTARQVEVFYHLLTGESEQVIARKLHRSTATVSEHICGIYRHFGVTSRGKLLAYLLQRDPLENVQASPPGVLN